MGALNRFERRLEEAVEGFFARTFRSGLQPIELAKALQRYAEDNQHVTERGVVVPNVYRFRLSERDLERLESFGDRLRRELGEVVVRTAAERGWKLRGPGLVRLEADPGVAFGTYQLTGRVETVDPDDTGAVTSAPPSRDGRAGPLVLRIVRGGEPGAEVPLAGPRLVAGRQSDCAVTLDDPTVSRQHAAFVNRAGDWWVVDLESTNGTRVNGTIVSEQSLAPGDRVELGEAVVELVDTGG